VLGKLAGAAKEIIVAWRYGISDYVDAYAFVFNLVYLPVAVWLSVLTVVLMPLSAKMGSAKSPTTLLFRNEALGWTIVLGGGLGLAFSFGMPVALEQGWLGLRGVSLQYALGMVQQMGWILPFGFCASLLSVFLMADGKHRSTLFEAVPAVTIIAFLLLPAGLGFDALVWGTIAGFLCHFAGVSLSLARRGVLAMPRLTTDSPEWPMFWSGFGVVAAGQALLSVTSVVDQFIAASMPTGTVATLGYANRLLFLVLGLLALTLTRSTLPVFSNMASGPRAAMHAFAMIWARRVVFISIAAVAVGWALVPWGVAQLFERGAFTPEDSAAVADAVRVGLIQAPAYVFSLTLATLMAASGRYVTIFLSGLIGLIVKVLSAVVLSSYLGLDGLILSATVLYLCTSAFFLVVLRR
jgi:putative peptidoglycan lipid II flippase